MHADRMKSLYATAAAVVIATPAHAHCTDLAERVKRLEHKLMILDMKVNSPKLIVDEERERLQESINRPLRLP